MNADQELLRAAVRIAVDAGKVVLRHYGKESPVDYKADDSPLTLADRASHELIVEALRDLTPDIPVLSEESGEEEIRERKEWRLFWLVDPLDGTKEFIKQTGQFTVNLGLIESAQPILGVVHVPVTAITYTGLAGRGAWREAPDEEMAGISVRRADPQHLTVVASKDHAGPQVETFLRRLSGARTASMGSSLKFCLVAQGDADFYPRLLPTMEWDTGAAQCIVEAAGGCVTDLEGNRLTYNKEDLRNPSFMAYGDRKIDWIRVFSG